ncbi:MAG: porin family protein [Gammaproteobacteria bacterium]|nr:porin family protein [Gammaproteobacteria bacterium]
MKNSKCVLTFATLVTILVFGFTTTVNATEKGPFMIAGVSYWNELDEIEIEFDLGFFGGTIEQEVDGSRAQLTVGVGYNFDDKFGVEGFYVSIPERLINVSQEFPPPIGVPGEALSVVWHTTVAHEVFGIAAVYDINVTERFSLFGKAGLAIARQTNDQSVTFGGRTTPVAPTVRPIVDEEDSYDLFGAIGARIPIRMGDASVTATYQFVETSVGRATGLQLGVQWNF